jgi:outer membrane protein OmpU
MTNFKKIGLTALAGSLAVTAYAQAGALSVNGTARMEYSTDTTTATNTTTSAFAQNTSISFSGSGELDNGMTVSYFSLQTATRNSSSQSVSVDMGDAGKIMMSNYNMAGIGMIQDKVPNGGEQPWDDNAATHGAPEQGVASPHGGNRLGYSNTIGGATISAALDYQQSSPTTSLAVSMPVMDGLEVGFGIATDQDSATTEQDIETAYVTYAMGGISVGYQLTEVNAAAANSDIDRTGYGISFAVNENLSVGYGVSNTEFEASSITSDEENTGIGIAYTSGGMKLGIINNVKDNAGGAGGTDQETTELQLTFAF